jgi:serine protease Do/serine protease DegQ
MNITNSAVVTVLVSCAAFTAGAALERTPATGPAASPAPQAAVTGETSLAPILARATPAVVSIGVHGHMIQRGGFEDLFGFMRQPMEREFQAAGSGVIVDANHGYIVTNNHLVENTDKIQVVLHDGRVLDADIVGRDAPVDLAVIHVNAENLTSLPVGDSDSLHVGDFVMAIGNPFGLTETATHGIVSALGRSNLQILGREGYEDYIQTDASINPGNSGGALINMKGELVGINAAIVGATGGNVGLGFAIPTNMVSKVMEQLIAHGEVRRGRLGVVVSDLTPDAAHDAGIEGGQGAVVKSVESGSAAAKAGLEVGDIVLKIDGTSVRGSGDLRAKIGVRMIGSAVKLDILRDGKKQTIRATISDPSKGKNAIERA